MAKTRKTNEKPNERKRNVFINEYVVDVELGFGFESAPLFFGCFSVMYGMRHLSGIASAYFRRARMSASTFADSPIISPESALESAADPADESLPTQAIDRLVQRVVAKFTAGEISTEEASSRLVGTGRFEENAEALEFLRFEICPRLEEQLHEVEGEIQRLQADAERIRGILGQGARAPVLANASAPAHSSQAATAAVSAAHTARSRKEKAEKAEREKADRKRKGASGEPASGKA